MEAWREELHDDLYHSFKGQEWKHHKYIRKEGNKYIYPEDVKSSSKPQKGWISDTVSSVGNAAATVGAAVSSAATSVANAVSDTWNTIASAVGSTATDLYNSVSSAVSNAISEHKDEPNWPKQKGQSETHNQVGIAEKTNVPWNEKLNNYIKTRLAIIGNDKERLSDLYTAVSYLTYNHLNSNGWISKPATTATPLHEGLDLASLAKAIDVDVSDLTEEDVAALTYALWGVLDAKIRGTKNPLVEGKGQIKDNIIDQIQGKPQQRQQLLNKINSNKDRLAPQNTASKTKNSKSVVIKPNNKKLVHSDDDLYHHGILGQKWGIRRFQNPDGSLTEEGRKRYGVRIRSLSNPDGTFTDIGRKLYLEKIFRDIRKQKGDLDEENIFNKEQLIKSLDKAGLKYVDGDFVTDNAVGQRVTSMENEPVDSHRKYMAFTRYDKQAYLEYVTSGLWQTGSELDENGALTGYIDSYKLKDGLKIAGPRTVYDAMRALDEVYGEKGLTVSDDKNIPYFASRMSKSSSDIANTINNFKDTPLASFFKTHDVFDSNNYIPAAIIQRATLEPISQYLGVKIAAGSRATSKNVTAWASQRAFLDAVVSARYNAKYYSKNRDASKLEAVLKRMGYSGMVDLEDYYGTTSGFNFPTVVFDPDKNSEKISSKEVKQYY